jgi:site-specific DNA recombinase
LLYNSAYYGKYVQFRTKSIGRQPGRKSITKRATSEEEQVIITVPAIITEELAERAKKRLATNKSLATRNNKASKESLLRGGLAKCAYCNTTLRIFQKVDTRKTGRQVSYFSYNCVTRYNTVGKCPGCSIAVDLLDDAAWAEAIKIMRDPSAVDKKIQKLTAESTVVKQRKRVLKSLAEYRNEQDKLRANLSKAMRKDILNEKSIAYLQGQLNLLEKQENEAKSQLADEQAMQRKLAKLQDRIASFHQQCIEWREKLDDPQFTPSYDFKREAIRFFGITATVWKIGTLPRFVFHVDPPDIVELLSA